MFDKPTMTFKQAINKLIADYESGVRSLRYNMGLCLEIEAMMYGLNYPGMKVFIATQVMMTTRQYNMKTLGADGSFTKKRYLKLKGMRRWTYSKYLDNVDGDRQILTEEEFG